MQRITFSVFTIIIFTSAFTFLWLTNPLYAFVGGVVFVAFMLIGLAFVFNSSSHPIQTEEEKSVYKPRRTGEFRSITTDELPEDSWDNTLSQPKPAQSKSASKPSIPAPQAPTSSELDDTNRFETIASPSDISVPKQNFGSGAPPQPSEPMPETHTPEFIDSPFISEPEPIVDIEESIAASEAENPKTEDLLELTDDHEDGIDTTKADTTDADFDDLTDDMKAKIDSGALGESAEEVDQFFRAAFEKAKSRNDIPDYIDDETPSTEFDDIDTRDSGDEIPDWLDDGDEADDDMIMFGDIAEEASEDVDRNIPDWLMQSMEDDLGSTDEILAPPTVDEDDMVNPSQPSKKTDRSGEIDLMGMVEKLEPDKQQEFLALMTEIPIGEQTETQLIALYQQFTSDADDNDSSSDQVSEAQFTAYYPRQASADTSYGFYVYAHLPNALIETDVAQFEQALGGRVPKAKVAQEVAKIETGTPLTVMVHCDDLKFNQVGAVQEWQPPFVRFDFRFRGNETLVDEIVSGRIAISLGMIEIASIDFQIAITPPNALEMITAIPVDPLTAHNFSPSQTVNLYQKIFISYSRKDSQIAEQYRKCQTMAGNIIFMDTHSIRAGQDWEQALKQFIDSADVFQLFWSEHSAQSDHVRFEWEYALTHRCADTRCVQFIRPTYWEKPLPKIPDDLNHLHFAYVQIGSD